MTADHGGGGTNNTEAELSDSLRTFGAVLKALRAGGIAVVAIHNHMTGESPRIMFLHYWGIGPTEALAKTIKSALDKTKHIPPAAP